MSKHERLINYITERKEHEAASQKREKLIVEFNRAMEITTRGLDIGQKFICKGLECTIVEFTDSWQAVVLYNSGDTRNVSPDKLEVIEED